MRCVLNQQKRRRYSTEAVRELRQVLSRIEQSDSPLDPVTYTGLLQRCGSSKATAEGRRVYSHYLSTLGGSESLRVKNQYIDMLGRSGCLEEARREFNKLDNKDDYSWNIMMGVYTQTGHGPEALRLLWQMDMEGERPSYIAYMAVLRACSCPELLHHGIRVQSRVAAEGLTCHVRLATAIQSMYGRCGRVEEARKLFDSAPVRDLITWNAMMSAYAQHGHFEEVLGLFRGMAIEGAPSSKATLISVLDACTKKRSLKVGRTLHACAAELGAEGDVMLATSLVNMYGKCGSFEAAVEVFEGMPWRDLVAWNAVLQACCEHERHLDAVHLFGRMDLEGLSPNESTYMSLVTACSKPAALSEGQAIHRILTSDSRAGYTDLVKGALINMYTKCGKLDEARGVFEQQCFRDLISWTSLILAYAASGEEVEAMVMFRKLDLEGLKPDRVAFLGALDGCSDLTEGRRIHTRLLESGRLTDMQVTALICMYAKCGSLEEAWRCFNDMEVKNTSAWTAMTSACCQRGQHREGMMIFRRMDLEGLRASEVTYIGVLEACANAPDLKQGRLIHERVISGGSELPELVSNAVVNMYGKCGSLEEARAVFSAINMKTTVSWSTLIGAFTHHGQTEEAARLFLFMHLDGFRPDDVIFVSILSACSHAGLVAESRSCFVSMAESYGVCFSSEHYGCILDVLGRAGRLEDAEDLILNMPYEPSGLQWMSLMCACKTHSDMDRALRIAEYVEHLAPEKVPQSCMLLSNMYSARGRFADAERMRVMSLAAQAELCDKLLGLEKLPDLLKNSAINIEKVSSRSK